MENAMTQNTMTEKDQFLMSFQRESATTTKVLKAYPSDRGDYKPHEKSCSAKDLAWTFVGEQSLADMALKGKIDFSQQMPAAPENFTECIAAFENECRKTATLVQGASDSDLSRTVQFPVGPGKMGDFRAMDVLWMTLMDQIHHRGQLSVYIRLAGGKVPSIYGPTADEPWR
jgi:uncharacterized damage-inducible protein DinB